MATSAESPLHNQLMEDLYHRFRPMPGHDPLERGRGSIPLELFYDLIYVIAFGFAAGELAYYVSYYHYARRGRSGHHDGGRSSHSGARADVVRCGHCVGHYSCFGTMVGVLSHPVTDDP